MFNKLKHLVETRPKLVYILLDIPMFLFTFVFIVMSGHWMDPEPLALLNVGLSIFTVISTFGLALQTVMARRIAAAEKILGSRDFLYAGIIIAAMTSVPFLFSKFFPHSKAIMEAGIMPFILVLLSHSAISFCRGVLQGTERFIGLWNAQAVEHVVRLILLYWYMDGRVTLAEGWTTVIIANVGHLLYAIYLMPREMWQDIRNQQDPQSGLAPEIVAVLLSNFFLNFLLSFDLIVAGEQLGDAGGAYVTANKFGKILFLVGASVATVILPLFSRAKSTPRLRIQILVGTGLYIVLSGMLSPFGAWVLDPFIRLAFPEAMVPTFDLMAWTLFANFSLCGIQLFVTWHIAQQTPNLMWLMGLCCGILIYLLTGSRMDGVEIISTTSFVVLFTTITLAILAYLDTRHTSDNTPLNTTDAS